MEGQKLSGYFKKLKEYYEQCVGCSRYFPFDQMSYYLTDMQWMCEDCASKNNYW